MRNKISFENMIGEARYSIDEILEREQPIRGLTTGYKELDKLTDGFRFGQLVTICGDADAEDFAISMLLKSSITQKTQIGFIHLKPNKLHDSLFEIFFQMDLADFRNYSKDKRKEIYKEHKSICKYLKSIPFNTYYLGDFYNCRSFEMLRQNIAEIFIDDGTSFFCINALQYTQLLNKSIKNEDQTEWRFIVNELKKLAVELNITIVLLTYLTPKNYANEPIYDLTSGLFGHLDVDGATCRDDSDILIRVDNPAKYFVEEDEKGNDLRGLVRVFVEKSPTRKSGFTYLRKTSRYVGERDDYTPLWQLIETDENDKDSFENNEEDGDEDVAPF